MERIHTFVNGKKISILKRDKTPIFYVHGSGCDATIWRLQLEEIGGFAIDLPNHGESDRVEICSVDDYAYFVANVVKNISGKGVIAGHSLGGAIAQMVYLKYREVVSGLALIGTGARLRVLPQVLDGLATRSHETAKLLAEMAFARKELIKQFADIFTKNANLLLDDLRICDKFDILEDYRTGKIRFEVPAIAIVGEKDFLTPVKYSKFFTDFGSEIAIVENSGHMVMIENPETLNEVLKNFLKKCSK
ncbi:MAG: alpha/beta hydrolase [Archaeoglobaceae archaeon]